MKRLFIVKRKLKNGVSLEERLKDCQVKCDEGPTPENLNALEIIQAEYDRHYDYITQGIIIRSRVNWCEQGEKSNKYFLNLENAKKKKSSIRKLSMDNDKETTEPKQIMTEIHNIYSKLYDKDSYNLGENPITRFLDRTNTKKLPNDQKEVLDKKLPRSELYQALKTFQRNKAPGNDGLTVEFYLAFWPILGKYLEDFLNFAHEHGQLSSSQKQAMITLLEKKDRDRRFIKNWRPISLMNVDIKIASKAIARRLETILPELIHHNQNGFIKGRSVFDAVKTIDDLLELAQITNKSGILVAIDFKKAFDSLDHTYLLKVLEKLNFGTCFLQWIKTFYTNISSCVLKNGFTTDLFQVRRGVWQDDPLSPLLFILAIEILAT